MEEIIDVYDIHGNKLNKTIIRGHSQDLKDGEYVKAVAIWIKSGIRYLIQKVSKEKGSWWAVTSGAVPTGQTSLTQAVVECKEELDLDVSTEDLEYLGTIYVKDVIIDTYIYDADNNLEDYNFSLQESEVEQIVWLTKDEIEDMIIKDNVRYSTSQEYLKFIKDY